MDKNNALITFLLTCPDIYKKPLYFNLAEPQDGIAQFVTMSNDTATQIPFIDGSVAKRYSLTVICFVSISSRPIVKIEGVENENIIEYEEIQNLINWISAQNAAHNFPNFGESCVVEKIYSTAEQPRLDLIDNSVQPALAKYSFTINVEYIDNENKLWN